MLQNKSQCGFDGLIPHRFPVAGEVIFPRVGMRSVLIADENRSHTVSEFVAAGAGQTRDCHGRVCFQQRPDTGSQMLRRAQCCTTAFFLLPSPGRFSLFEISLLL